MAKPSTIRKDCFACKENIELRGGEIVAERECTALNGMDCKKGECGFYKTKFTHLRELIRFNGTPNLDEATQNYELSRKARGLSD